MSDLAALAAVIFCSGLIVGAIAMLLAVAIARHDKDRHPCD